VLLFPLMFWVDSMVRSYGRSDIAKSTFHINMIHIVILIIIGRERKYYMTTQFFSPDELPKTAHTCEEDQTILPWQAEEEEAFYIEGEQPDLLGNPFVAPFQLSNEMPLIAASKQPSDQSPVESVSVKRAVNKPRFSLSLNMIVILICVVVLVGLL